MMEKKYKIHLRFSSSSGEGNTTLCGAPLGVNDYSKDGIMESAIPNAIHVSCISVLHTHLLPFEYLCETCQEHDEVAFQRLRDLKCLITPQQS